MYYIYDKEIFFLFMGEVNYW